MKASSELFNLIKSLSPNEKRYFKIFASRHKIGKKNNYEELFDAIDGQADNEEYDEAAVKELLKKKPWIKNLAVQKSQLEDLVLKAMRSYHEDKVLGKLETEIGNIKFLYEKGLLDNAMKRLAKAFDFAKEQEDLNALLVLYQNKLNMTKMIATSDEEAAAELDYDNEALVLKMMDAERRISHIRRKVYNMYINGTISREREAVGALMVELDTISAGVNITLKGQFKLLNTKAMIYDGEHKYGEALDVYQKMLDLWDDNINKIGESNNVILILLSNYLSCAHRLERYSDFPKIIDRIENLELKNSLDKQKAMFMASQNKLLYALNVANLPFDNQLIEDIELGIANNRLLILPKTFSNIKLNIALYLLMHKQYQRANNFAKTAFEENAATETFKIEGLAFKFMELATDIALDEFDDFDNKLRNWVRWLKVNQLYNQYTQLVIKCLKSMLVPKRERKPFTEMLTTTFPPNLMLLQEIYVLWMGAK